ncbi:MAG: hypothetical protein DRI57_13085 [Deltaproteobacteria bacterium]|nr:MAG: hypothetical protein DRI57_13085 [Deltaproteobacteria bacterium]
MKKITLFVLCLFSFLYPTVAMAQNETSFFTPNLQEGKLGDYKALIIEVSEYHNPKLNLKNPKNDAMAMAKLLCERYGFHEVKLLLNHQATREAIYNELLRLGDTGKETDSVLIYYSGHGEICSRTKDDG